jgi:hypothetical protein
MWRGLKGDTVYPGDASLAVTRKLYKQALKAATTSGADPDGD